MHVPSHNSAAALAAIRAKIIAAALAAARDPATIHLTAVSKQQPWSAVSPVVAAGQTVFGENRVQEAMGRWGKCRAGLELRLIGPLQTNKVGEAVGFFDVIETLDRPRLAERLEREIQRLGRAPRLYVQVNTGEESQKAGVAPGDVDRFLDVCREAHHLSLEGMMCIPPIDEPAGPHFALLAKLARCHGLSRLSMGMSDDFEIAIGHGATDLRVGAAIFGARSQQATIKPLN